MDYYQVLRLGPNASRKDIEQAYHRLLKEARYDTSIDKMQIENAYRILSDLASKSQYDARQNVRNKRNIRVEKKRKPALEFGIIDWIKRRTLPQLLATLGVVLSIAITFYAMRYGYVLKEFQAGDVLYDSLTDARFGKILKVEHDHPFGPKIRMDAYQVELDPGLKRPSSEKIAWFPQNTVKARCYKQEK